MKPQVAIIALDCPLVSSDTFSQVPHGNCTGPGFNDTSPDSKSNLIQIVVG
jgi:hypothetical protein